MYTFYTLMIICLFIGFCCYHIQQKSINSHPKFIIIDFKFTQSIFPHQTNGWQIPMPHLHVTRQQTGRNAMRPPLLVPTLITKAGRAFTTGCAQTNSTSPAPSARVAWTSHLCDQSWTPRCHPRKERTAFHHDLKLTASPKRPNNSKRYPSPYWTSGWTCSEECSWRGTGCFRLRIWACPMSSWRQRGIRASFKYKGGSIRCIRGWRRRIWRCG